MFTIKKLYSNNDYDFTNNPFSWDGWILYNPENSKNQVENPLDYNEKYKEQLISGLIHTSYNENDNEYIFSLYVPGFKKEDISIKIKSDSKGTEMLYITGSKTDKSNSVTSSDKFSFVEYLPETYKDITSKLENGILKIIIVKDKEVEKPIKERKIEIE